jgi:DNA helicase HerA-like ATPase
MILEYLVNGLIIFFVIIVVTFIVLIALWLAFPSARPTVSALFRVVLHGTKKVVPYVVVLSLGAGVGVMSYEALSFIGERVRTALSLVLLFTCFYLFLSLVKHHVRWSGAAVRFVAVSCCLVVPVDFVFGVFLVDDWVRLCLSWGLSFFLCWVLFYERDTVRGMLHKVHLLGVGGEREKPKYRQPEVIRRSRNDDCEVSESHSDDVVATTVRASEPKVAETVVTPSKPGYHALGQERADGDEDPDGIGSVEILEVSEGYLSGKLGDGAQGDLKAVLEGENASGFRGFVTSMLSSGNTFAFKQVFRGGQGKFFIQCRAREPTRIKRLLQNVDAQLHSWFPDFQTKIHLGEVDLGGSSGSWASGWVSNLPAPSRNPMRRVAELFLYKGLTGCVTVIAEPSTSNLSSFSHKRRYKELVEKARREEQRQPLLDMDGKRSTRSKRSYDSEKELEYVVDKLDRLDSKLQAKCWVSVECENSTFEEAEEDLKLAQGTLVAAFTHEGKYHSMRSGKFPQRQCMVVHDSISKLVPKGESTVLLPSDLALYFWLPEIDSVAKVKRKADFLAPTREETSAGEVFLGYVVRHGTVTDQKVFLSVEGFMRQTLIVGATGTGKSTTSRRIALSLNRLGIPFIVFEPVKKEWRNLIGAVPRLRVFTVGDESVAPLRFNVLRVPDGVKQQRHADMFYASMVSSVVMWPPAPYVLQMALHRTYAKFGWDSLSGRRGRDFGLRDLNPSVEEIIREQGYVGEVKANVAAALSLRFESLSQSAKGAALNSSVSMSPKELLEAPTVVELSEMGSEEDRALVILMMLSSIYEYLLTLGTTSKPRCAIIIEEAGSLFAKAEGKGAVEYTASEARGKAVETISDIVARIRSLGGMVIFINQSAVNLPQEVSENTSTKIIHQVADDKNAVSATRTLGLDADQGRAMTSLEVGRAVLKVPGVSHPFLVQVADIDEFGVDPRRNVSDNEAMEYMRRTFFAEHPEYLRVNPVRAMPPVKRLARKRGLPPNTENYRAKEIAASTRFGDQYVRALKSCKPHDIRPMVDLLWSWSVLYDDGADGATKFALDLFTEASFEYSDGLRADSYWGFRDALQVELPRRASSYRDSLKSSSE